MKSRVDIFRPLAAATRSCRPDSATSIFRRKDKSGSPPRSADSDDSFVVSVPPGDWPPHKDTLGSAASDSTSANGRLRTSVPLLTGTTVSSGAEEGSPSSVLGSSRRTTAVRVTPPPSYYKIEIDPENDEKLQLTAGDDASVQFTPELHNQRLQLANDGFDLGESLRVRRENGIARASPVGERADRRACGPTDYERPPSRQRWTIGDGGAIVAVPPSPSEVSMTHAKPSARRPRHGRDDDLSVPPLLVKADSAGSSSSGGSSSEGSPLAGDDFVCCEEEGAEVLALESPPRMTRSVLSPSLFQDSVSGESSRSSSQGIGEESNCVRRMASSCGGGRAGRSSRGGRRARTRSGSSRDAEGQAGCGNGGCGTRSRDLLGMVLDIFSLNGPCCQQREAGATPVDAVLCR